MRPLGQKAAAQKIDDALLDQFPGLDRGYELLLLLNGTNVIPRLDELFARDQFEERPLIWKAHVLQQENQLAEAEKIIRQAIAIDPTDGEEGPGRPAPRLCRTRRYFGCTRQQKDAKLIMKSSKPSACPKTADQFYHRRTFEARHSDV